MYFFFMLQQSDFDMLLVSLRMDAVHAKESMRIGWVSEAGMVENIAAVIKEYKDSRNLQVSMDPFNQAPRLYKKNHIQLS